MVNTPPPIDPVQLAEVAAELAADRACQAQSASAFAALTAIESGDWDRFLLRLRAAIEARRGTDEYWQHVVAR
jgi:hypothetical protein